MQECRGNSLRKLIWQYKELIFFFSPPLILVQRREALSGSQVLKRGSVAPLQNQSTCPMPASVQVIHVTSLQNSNHVTPTKKSSHKTLKGDEISYRLFTCSHLTHPVRNFFFIWDVTLTNDACYSLTDLTEAKDIYDGMDITLCCWLERYPRLISLACCTFRKALKWQLLPPFLKVTKIYKYFQCITWNALFHWIQSKTQWGWNKDDSTTKSKTAAV